MRKSWLGCEWLIYMCLTYPDTKWFIGRTELKRLLSSTFETFRKVCKHHGIEEETYWKYNGALNYIRFKNGSKIDLLDVSEKPSDPLFERFGSTEYTGGFGEEVGEWPFKAFDVLKSRIGRQMNKEYSLKPKFLLTANPKRNWVKRIFYTPFVNGVLDIKYAFVKSLYSDNKYTATDYGENLDEISDPVLKARLKDGDWEYADDMGTLVAGSAIEDMWFNALDYTPNRYATLDVARKGKDKSKLWLWQGLNCYKRIEFNDVDTMLMADKVAQILREERIQRSHLVVDEVGVGGPVADRLRGCRGFIANSTPLESPNTRQVRVMVNGDWKYKTQKDNFKTLKDQCGYKLADHINNRTLAVECSNEEEKERIAQEIGWLRDKTPDSDGKKQLVPKEDIKKDIQRSPDDLDCMIMRMIFEFLPKTNSPDQSQNYAHEEGEEYGS